MGRHLDVLTPPLQLGGDLVDQEHTSVFLVHVLSAAVVLVEDEFAAQAFACPFGKVAGEGLHEATLLCAHHSTKSWLVFAARAVCDGHHDFGLFRKSRTGSRKFQPKREELEANRRYKSKSTRGGYENFKTMVPIAGRGASHNQYECKLSGDHLFADSRPCKPENAIGSMAYTVEKRAFSRPFRPENIISAQIRGDFDSKRRL